MNAASSPLPREPVAQFLSLLPLRSFFALSSRFAPNATAPIARRLFCVPRGPRAIRIDHSKYPPFEAITLGWRAGTIRGYAWRLDSRRPRVLLAHGWGGWGLQFAAMITALIDAGCEVVTFDQPAHGASSGHVVTLPEFARALRFVADSLGPFDAVIGHSLGGAAAAFALAHGLAIERAVLIAAPADAEAETRRFARFLWIPEHVRGAMQRAIEAAEGVTMNELRARSVAPRITASALLIHDRADREVAFECLDEYAGAWRTRRVLATQGLGHNRILRDAQVIAAVCGFVRS